MTQFAEKQRLCQVEDLPDPGSRGFTLATAAGLREIFVVRQGDAIRGYLNACPHTGGPLDWQPDQFLSLDGRLIQCATHLAMFRIDDGHCVAGPCAGQSLSPVRVELAEGWIWAKLADLGAISI